MLSYHFEQEEKIPSPALIYYQDQIEENTKKAIAMAGGAQRLWPHMKTHKMAEMIRMQMQMGIRRFKCATVSEIRMVAREGAIHILWAYPVIGPNVNRFLALMQEFPACSLYALEDNMEALRALAAAAKEKGLIAQVLLDINIGMNRTGMAPEEALLCYEQAQSLEGVSLLGLHCYDGHIHDHDLNKRQSHAEGGALAAHALRKKLQAAGYHVPIMIMGGTPTFPCHAGEEDVFLSPGTLFVSDHGYQKSFPDIDVIPAAAVLTRVISHPGEDLFTLDAGVKALSADPDPRGVLAGMEDICTPILSSEEHWVFQMKKEYRHLRPAIGTVLYAIPTHVCTTTALYDAAYICSKGKLVDIWQVAARERVGKDTLEAML